MMRRGALLWLIASMLAPVVAQAQTPRAARGGAAAPAPVPATPVAAPTPDPDVEDPICYGTWTKLPGSTESRCCYMCFAGDDIPIDDEIAPAPERYLRLDLEGVRARFKWDSTPATDVASPGAPGAGGPAGGGGEAKPAEKPEEPTPDQDPAAIARKANVSVENVVSILKIIQPPGEKKADKKKKKRFALKSLPGLASPQLTGFGS